MFYLLTYLDVKVSFSYMSIIVMVSTNKMEMEI